MTKTEESCTILLPLICPRTTYLTDAWNQPPGWQVKRQGLKYSGMLSDEPRSPYSSEPNDFLVDACGAGSLGQPALGTKKRTQKGGK
ncbi:MAG: hypothetical protein DRH97_01370 [Chloroflexi bacterium]|nr:MAG: hypothetical protein DRH97_01370 [Chloroflexota bacterium]